MGSRFIHLIRTDSNVFLFIAEKYCIVYASHSFFIHSSVDGHQGCFHILPIVEYCSEAWGYMCLFQFWFPQGIFPVVELLDHMIGLFLVFKSNLHAVCSPRWLYQFAFPPTGKDVPFSPHPLSCLLSVDFLMMIVLTCQVILTLFLGEVLMFFRFLLLET